MSEKCMSFEKWLNRNYPDWEIDGEESIDNEDFCPICEGYQEFETCDKCQYTGSLYVYNRYEEYKRQRNIDLGLSKVANKGIEDLPLFAV